MALKYLLFLGLFLSSFFSRQVFAENFIPTPPPASDSYTLFYPIVAGKTEGESLYFLKTWRDKLSEFLAFDDYSKSEVYLRNATKKLLESEKLYKTGKFSLAGKTLEAFTNKINNSYELAMKNYNQESNTDLLQKIKSENEKYEILLKQLSTDFFSEKSAIEKALTTITNINNKIGKI